LYFYPRDNTPGCTKQACAIAQNYDALTQHDIKIFGINYQSPEVHRAFKKQYHLPFTLLSDTHKNVSSAYGAYSWWHPIFPKRITILIENHRIIKIIDDVDVTRHVEQIFNGFGIKS
jgi:peroxiredoxin Q/BCP